MKKNELTAKYREYAKNSLSPTGEERTFVSQVYASVRETLGSACFLIGSYARFTAGRPLHDLDVMFAAGSFDPNNLNPQAVLAKLKQLIQTNFRNPTVYQTRISVQSHSITISFLEGHKERFGVDIVPAFTSGLKNAYGDPIYWVPEIAMFSRHNRSIQYGRLEKAKKREAEWWLKSDPLGYIRATTDLNARNGDFRKAAKLVKKWKHNCCAKYEDFKLKSFHVEQVMFRIYEAKPNIELSEALFVFFCELPDAISSPQIPDRADSGRFIDEYLRGLARTEKQRIIAARDFLLIQLESLKQSSNVGDIVAAGTHERPGDAEKYLFDSGIPVFLESDNHLKISAKVLARDGFRPSFLDSAGLITVDRKIEFTARTGDDLAYDLLKWKVKNDNSSPQPRGEITDHRTRNVPEHTKYKGSHFVECYAIKDSVCIAKARQNVVLASL